jgi:hypothetical protein
LSPKKGEVFLVFEAASISLFPGDKKIIPVLGGRGRVGQGKVEKVPDLRREGALQEEVRNGFRGCKIEGASGGTHNSPFLQVFCC